MENCNPEYYVVIPTRVVSARDISQTAKLLYGVITSFWQTKGVCWATNARLAEAMGDCDERTVSRAISELRNNGYIVTEKEGRSSRKIYLAVCAGDGQGVDKNVHPDTTTLSNPHDKIVYPIPFIKKENKKEKNSFDPKPVFVEWIDKDLPHLTAPHGEILGAREKNMLYIALVNFSDNRHAMKKPIPSKAAVTAILNRLVKFTRDTPNRVAAMIDILELATSSNWQTVYAPKDANPAAPAKPQGGSVMIEI